MTTSDQRIVSVSLLDYIISTTPCRAHFPWAQDLVMLEMMASHLPDSILCIMSKIPLAFNSDVALARKKLFFENIKILELLLTRAQS